MVVAIFFDYLRYFFFLFLGALSRIWSAVYNTGHRVLYLRPSLRTVDHDFRLEDNHIVLDGRFQQIPTARWSTSRSSAGRVI
jgi:hypothetical protein